MTTSGMFPADFFLTESVLGFWKTANACHSTGMPKQKDDKAMGCQNKRMSKQMDVKAN